MAISILPSTARAQNCGGTSSGFTAIFPYDSKGELTTVSDPRENATHIAYTSAGQMSSVTDAQGNATAFAYDARGTRTSSTDALNNALTLASI